MPPSPLSTRSPPARSPIRAVSTPCRSRYSVSAPWSRPASGPTTSAITGTPSSTTAASSGDTSSSSRYGDIRRLDRILACAITCTSPTPIVTTSPAAARRSSAAPSRTVCPTTTFTVRKLASIRTFVMVRCRIMLTQAVNAVTPTRAAAQPASAAMSPVWSPSSTARDIRYGVDASSTIHTLPYTAPATQRPGCRRTSHHR